MPVVVNFLVMSVRLSFLGCAGCDYVCQSCQWRLNFFGRVGPVVNFDPSCRSRLASVGRAGCLLIFLDRSGSRLIVVVFAGCGNFFLVPITVDFFWSYRS